MGGLLTLLLFAGLFYGETREAASVKGSEP